MAELKVRWPGHHTGPSTRPRAVADRAECRRDRKTPLIGPKLQTGSGALLPPYGISLPQDLKPDSFTDDDNRLAAIVSRQPAGSKAVTERGARLTLPSASEPGPSKLPAALSRMRFQLVFPPSGKVKETASVERLTTTQRR